MILTMVRHAQTEGSRRELYYGAADIPALPESLAELHENANRYPTAPRYYTSGLLRTEQNRQLYAALGRLKPEYRETLYLIYFEDLSYREAARVLGRTEQQVTNLVYRGRQRLRQLLEQEGYQHEN